MPKITVMGKQLHYESFGDGEPVVFLNGIMMSTLSWKPFLKAFSRYQVVLVDLLDQGTSDKADGEYDQNMHVEMLKELFIKLGYEKVHMLGISYGGEVAIKFALKYGQALHSLILANTTARTTGIMKDIEAAWDFAAGTHDGSVFFKATMPYIYSRKFYEEHAQWLKERERVLVSGLTPEWYEGFRRAIRSASTHDETSRLSQIEAPTLVIGAELDLITPLDYQRQLCAEGGIRNSRMVILPGSGHASMYEKPYEFAAAVLGFLECCKEQIIII